MNNDLTLESDLTSQYREVIRKALERGCSIGTLRKAIEDATVTFGMDAHTVYLDVLAEELTLAIVKNIELEDAQDKNTVELDENEWAWKASDCEHNGSF